MCSDISTYGDSIQMGVNTIDGVSGQFKEDMNTIYEKNKENIYIVLILDEFVSVFPKNCINFSIQFSC